mmetsp:Transcript_24616/g.64792  ORF Transcript_24616/g.64792 Transcript_24616/m.64792 type:complete len:95 (+) Transcript_24616:109-393(+)
MAVDTPRADLRKVIEAAKHGGGAGPKSIVQVSQLWWSANYPSVEETYSEVLGVGDERRVVTSKHHGLEQDCRPKKISLFFLLCPTPSLPSLLLR